MIQPQMDWDWFRNVGNLDLVKPNWIMDSISRPALDCYFVFFFLFFLFFLLRILRIKMNIAICRPFDAENVAYMHLLFDNARYSPNASSNVNYFLFCGWCEVCFIWNNDKQQSKCCKWTESGPKMLWDQTEAMLDWRGPGPGPGQVCTNTNYDIVNE